MASQSEPVRQMVTQASAPKPNTVQMPMMVSPGLPRCAAPNNRLVMITAQRKLRPRVNVANR